MEFTYDRTIFKDHYKRQHREELCSTIVAHLSKDGLMFVHPTQNRSLTPREAARVQSSYSEMPCRHLLAKLLLSSELTYVDHHPRSFSRMVRTLAAVQWTILATSIPS